MAYDRITSALHEQLTSQFVSQFQEQKKESFFESIEYQNTIIREFRWLKVSLDRCIPFPAQEEITEATRNSSQEQKRAFWENLKDLSKFLSSLQLSY